eukprot:2674554-Prymnesium_polylepis.1
MAVTLNAEFVGSVTYFTNLDARPSRDRDDGALPPHAHLHAARDDHRPGREHAGAFLRTLGRGARAQAQAEGPRPGGGGDTRDHALR